MTSTTRSNESITLDPDDPFEAVLIEAIKIRRDKRDDYTGDDPHTQSFYDVAYQNNDSAGKAVEHLVATKQTRLRTLLNPNRRKSIKNESIRDTMIDRLNYSALAICVLDEGGYDSTKRLVCSWEADA